MNFEKSKHMEQWIVLDVKLLSAMQQQQQQSAEHNLKVTRVIIVSMSSRCTSGKNNVSLHRHTSWSLISGG